jgi:periplasmic protein TonB
MSEKYIEKTFLWLVLVSVLLHAAFLAIVIYLPEEPKLPGQMPYMVDLQDMPSIPEHPVRPKQKVRRPDEHQRRAPMEKIEKDKTPSALRPNVAPVPQPLQTESGQPERPAERGETVVKEKQGGDFFRRKEPKVPDIARLFPNAEKQAKLEEGYRRKYGQEVAEGGASFLNTDDLQFGSFMRRLESAIYGVWRYPADAARLGIEGVTPVRITFNRHGEIDQVEILQSSGSKILDDEVRRTLKMIGPVGGFPRGYDKETFNVIAFFHYNIVGGMIQGTLH